MEFRRAAGAAAALGVEPGRLREAEEAIAAKVQAAVQELQAAVEAVPFAPDAYQVGGKASSKKLGGREQLPPSVQPAYTSYPTPGWRTYPLPP